MIQANQVLDMLVQVCPTFERERNEHVASYGNDVLYVAAGAFAHHLLVLQLKGATSCFASVGNTIELMHTDGVPEVKELATIGLLEGIQNVWGHSTTNPDVFLQYLGPASLNWWHALNNFWSGKATGVRSGA